MALVSDAAENDGGAKNSFLQIISVGSQNFFQIISSTVKTSIRLSSNG